MDEAKTCNNCIYSYTYSEYSARNGNLMMNVEGVLKQANPDKGNFVTNFLGTAPAFFVFDFKSKSFQEISWISL